MQSPPQDTVTVDQGSVSIQRDIVTFLLFFQSSQGVFSSLLILSPYLRVSGLQRKVGSLLFCWRYRALVTIEHA